MREEPTKAEVITSAALAHAFREAGHSVEIPDREATDRPDIFLKINGISVAVECTQIPPSYVFQHQHTAPSDESLEAGNVVSVLYPNEPHMWVDAAIRKKARHVPAYMDQVSASECWLLIHAPPEDKNYFVDAGKEWIQHALAHGATLSSHPFKQVYVWTAVHGLLLVYHRQPTQSLHSDLGFQLTKGYPTLASNRIRLDIRTVDVGEAATSTSQKYDRIELSVVEPVDPLFKRHQPAQRSVEYRTSCVASCCAATVRVWIRLDSSTEEMEVDPIEVPNLEPRTSYHIHWLHHLVAPAQLETHYRVQSTD